MRPLRELVPPAAPPVARAANGVAHPPAVAAAGQAEAPDAIVELCAVRVGPEEYVIDLRRIREILKPLPITAVPRAPAFVEGVMNLRGEVVPVVDVRKRLGVPAGDEARAKVLVVNIAGRVLGLVVDAVIEVVRIPRSAIAPAPLLADGPRLYLGVCGSREPRLGARAAAAGRPGARKLRMLLNVKALLEPGPPGPILDARGAGAA